MLARSEHDTVADVDQDAFSLLALCAVILRRRRLVMLLGAVGLVVGVVLSVVPARMYRTVAVFQPQVGESQLDNLALVASRFGIQAASGEGDWGVPVYVELLRMHSLLEPIARDTIPVLERSGQRVAVVDLLEVEGPTQQHRIDRAVRELQGLVRSREIGHIGAVEVSARTPWPSVSLALVERLVHGVDRFNVETRRSQAAAERSFVALQAQDARDALLLAEERLLTFLQRNRAIAGSPELTFEHDRLQREVDQRQQVYTSLTQSLEEARIREIRDTPVITMLEAPRLAVEPESRRIALHGVLGLFTGLLVALLAGVMILAHRHLSRKNDGDVREFLDALNASLRGALRRQAR